VVCNFFDPFTISWYKGTYFRFHAGSVSVYFWLVVAKQKIHKLQKVGHFCFHNKNSMNIFANSCLQRQPNDTSSHEVVLSHLLLVIHTCSWITCYVFNIGYPNRTSLFLFVRNLWQRWTDLHNSVTSKYKILCVESVMYLSPHVSCVARL